MSIIYQKRTKRISTAVIAASLALAGLVLYHYQSGDVDTEAKPVVLRLDGREARAPMANPAEIAPNAAPQGRSTHNEAPLEVALFQPNEIADNLKAFLKALKGDPPMSREEQDKFVERFLTSIESNPEAQKRISEYYRTMPANPQLDRDLLRQMLVTSPVGRALVLGEANDIWDSKNKKLYGEMYEAYFNMPGQASQEVFANALSELGQNNTDLRSTVAALNFVGTLEKETFGEAANLRQQAIGKMNELASGSGDDVVRALAVQKIYRLSSPAEASNVAVQYLANGAYGPLVMETLNSVASGDVQLSATLKTALTSAVNRPSASKEEQQRYREVIAGQS